MPHAIGQLQDIAHARPAHAHGVAAFVFVKGNGAGCNQRAIKAAVRCLHIIKDKKRLIKTSIPNH
jgi:hypothetical protein